MAVWYSCPKCEHVERFESWDDDPDDSHRSVCPADPPWGRASVVAAVLGMLATIVAWAVMP